MVPILKWAQKEQKQGGEGLSRKPMFTIGELIAQVYVEENWPKGTKEKLMEDRGNIRTVYAAFNISRRLAWYEPTSPKQKRLSKLRK
jgi:predicted metalloendopeptidase